jgi:hypothetical protein
MICISSRHSGALPLAIRVEQVTEVKVRLIRNDRPGVGIGEVIDARRVWK